MQEYIPAIVYELSCRARTESDLNAVRVVLCALNFPQEKWAEGDGQGEHVIKIFTEDLNQSNRFHVLFQKLNLTRIKVSQRALKPKDWLTRWKTGWKPGALTEKIDIVPVWHKKSYVQKKGRDFLLMDTLMSFGTGLHETTRMVAQLIEDRQGQYKSVLDIGTGTGILAMVAIKYGATKVIALDIGELSVEAALSNMKLNKLNAKVLLADIGTYNDKTKYDFVAANLVTHDLIRFSRKILNLVRPGGLLAVSGISLERLQELRKGFKGLPLKELKVMKGTQWTALLYQKKMS